MSNISPMLYRYEILQKISKNIKTCLVIIFKSYFKKTHKLETILKRINKSKGYYYLSYFELKNLKIIFKSYSQTITYIFYFKNILKKN